MSDVLSMGRPWDLARAWERLRAEEPGVRARDAARKLGTSAVRLGPNFGALAFVVRKLTTDGIVTSLEVFDDSEDLVVQVFGQRKPGQRECARWRRIVEGLCGEPLSD